VRYDDHSGERDLARYLDDMRSFKNGRTGGLMSHDRTPAFRSSRRDDDYRLASAGATLNRSAMMGRRDGSAGAPLRELNRTTSQILKTPQRA
jgi:hypothetical protein